MKFNDYCPLVLARIQKAVTSCLNFQPNSVKTNSSGCTSHNKLVLYPNPKGVDTNLVEDKWILLVGTCLANGKDGQDPMVVHLSTQFADGRIVLLTGKKTKLKLV